MSRQTNNPADRHASEVNNNAPDRIKSLSQGENPRIREISSCLVPCSECTGVYIDAISGTKLRIICRHQCHSADKI